MLPLQQERKTELPLWFLGDAVPDNSARIVLSRCRQAKTYRTERIESADDPPCGLLVEIVGSRTHLWAIRCDSVLIDWCAINVNALPIGVNCGYTYFIG